MNIFRRMLCPPGEGDNATVVAEANSKLSAMLDVQRSQLDETRGLRAEVLRILERLEHDPLPLTGQPKGTSHK